MFAFRSLTKALQCAALIATASALAPAISHAEPPKKDHPLVGRYEGSELIFTDIKAYDEADLIQGRTKWPQEGVKDYLYGRPDFVADNVKPNVVHVEGPVSTYQYKLPEGRSILEVQRSYENSLKAKGFDIVFTCKVTEKSDDGSCFDVESDKKVTRPIETLKRAVIGTNWPIAKRKSWDDISGMYFHFKEAGRYLFAKREATDGVTYVSIALSDKSSDSPYTGEGMVINESTAFVRVVEGKPMETGKIKFVDASAMQKSLHDTGRVNLYGIHFDFDKDAINPDSQPTIDEMIKLLRANPQMKLQVVGHTDSQGQEAHNNDLSSRRAGSVTRALVQAGIGVERLSSRGAGSTQPVASNDTEDGRAKNRRVELVGM